MIYDSRTLSIPVYRALQILKGKTSDQSQQKEQRDAARELYSFLSTWGLLRLKAEQGNAKKGRKQILDEFFVVLEGQTPCLPSKKATIETYVSLQSQEYLGVTGLALAIAQEFIFWGNSIYADIKSQ